MLQKMRDSAQSWVARLIAGVIILVLTVFGFGAFSFFTAGEPVAAKVNGDEISQNELARAAERRKNMILAQLGESVDPSLIDTQALLVSTLDTLINRTLLLQVAEDLDLVASRRQVEQDIRENPQFQVDGKYDKDRYRMQIANLGLSPISYQEEFSTDTQVIQLTGSFRDTSMLTDRELREAASLLTQTRDISYLLFNPDNFAEAIEVTEEDVEQYYDSNGYEFMTEQSADVEYVELSLVALMDEVEVGEDEILGQYETDKAAYSGNERRHVAHILLEVNDSRSAEQAETEILAAKAKIESGVSFEELAKTLSGDAGSAVNGGDLGFTERNKGTFVPEFERVVWSLSEGQMSDAVRTEFGIHLIKLIEIGEAEYPILDDVREGIVQGIKRGKAQDVFNTHLNEMDEIAFEESDTLMGVADALGLSVQSLAGVSPTTASPPFENADLRRAVFEADVHDKGFNSRPMMLNDRAVVVRVTQAYPAEPMPLDNVTDEIDTIIRAERARDAAVTAASSAFAMTESGDPASVVANEYGLSWEVHEATQQNVRDVPNEILRTAFRLTPPVGLGRSVGRSSLASGTEAVVTVSAVRLGDYGALTESERAALRAQLSDVNGQQDLDGLLQTLQEGASITRNF
ncbi:MAG: SurA N-terminal domain-containing protein [Gammaproteobacteria bacterium]|nr:SurA N-terminal domain-containing protein [Gammaproteobacteria bacterium]